MTKANLTVALVLLLVNCVLGDALPNAAGWRTLLKQHLPILGHRNWIVIADSAYPEQNSAGIVTIETSATQIEVVEEVLKEISASRHVAPIIYEDSELRHLTDKLAPGVSRYRKELEKVLGGRPVQGVLHSDMIAKLDEAGKTFKVLVLKTTMTIPYTTVFFNLDCKYWGPEKEKQLRELMKKH